MKRYNSVLVTALVFLLLFGLYGFSAASHPVGYADSTEIILTGYYFSVAHPPGYQLMVGAVGAAIRVLPFLSPAYAANLVNALIQATALTVMFRAILLVYKRVFPAKKLSLAYHMSAAFSVLLLGASALFWLYGGVVEVRSMNNLLGSLVFFGGLKYWQTIDEKRSGLPWLIFTGVFTGLGVLHHPTFLLVLPALFFILVLTHKTRLSLFELKGYLKQIGIGIAAILIGMVLSIALLVAFNQNDQEFSWSFPTTPGNIVHHLLRQDYSGHFVTEGKTYEQNLEKDNQTSAFGSFKPLIVAKNFLPYAKFQVQQLGVYFVILSLLGTIILVKKDRNTAIPLLAFALFAGPILGAYLILPDLTDNQNLLANMRTGIIHRQYLLGQLALTPLVAIAAAFIVSETLRFRRTWLKYMLIFIGCSLLALQLVDNVGTGFQKHNTMIAQHAKATLEAAEPNSVVICGSDIACFSLFYANKIEKIRPDITILTKNNLYRAAFLRRHHEYYPFSYNQNPAFHAQQLSWNVYHRPTYLTDPTVFYVDYIGMDGNPFIVVPTEGMFKVQLKEPELSSKPLSVHRELLGRKANVSPKDYFFKGVLDHFAGITQYRGEIFVNYGKEELAKREFEYSLDLNPNYQKPLAWLYEINKEKPVDPKYVRADLPTSAEYLKEAKELYPKNKEEAFKLTRKAVYIDPLNAEARLFLAAQYTLTNRPEWAELELSHVQRLIPTHQIPKDPLNPQTYVP